MLEILSLGAGVQSSVLLLMSCKGELPKLDASIFADTLFEPAKVYKHLAWLKEQAAAAKIPVYTVSAGNLKTDIETAWKNLEEVKATGKRFASIPLFTLENGVVGQIKRQCTSEYKIEPIGKFIKRELLGVAKHKRAPFNAVRQWIGISTDEMKRMRISDERWRVNYYPLVFDKGMNRADCIKWFKLNYPNRELPESSCLCCPFKCDEDWLELQSNPQEWQIVVAFDKSIRKTARMRGETFLHRSCKPLDEIDFEALIREKAERKQQKGKLYKLEVAGQHGLFTQECLGMCGV